MLNCSKLWLFTQNRKINLLYQRCRGRNPIPKTSVVLTTKNLGYTKTSQDTEYYIVRNWFMVIAISKGWNLWDILSSALYLLEIFALLHQYLAPNRKKHTHTKKKGLLFLSLQKAIQNQKELTKQNTLVLFNSDVMHIKVLSFV